MNAVAKASLLALVATCGYLPAAHAETAAEFLARAVCETAANKTAVEASLREFVIKACSGGEMARSLEYKKSLMPAHIYSRCTVGSNSLAESHECLDRAVFDLPPGTARSLWQLQSGGGAWVFWTFEDCNTARVALGGGVCVGG
jgi:hypothetical protein